jgi:adenylate cyclase
VARDIAGKVRVRLTAQERTRLANAPTVNPEAYDFYLRGRSLANRNNKADSQVAIEMLEHAVAKDPTFAAAHARLAVACVDRYLYFAPEDQSWWEAKAYAAVENALSLDPDLSDAYLARGLLLWTPSNHFPHERAIQEIRRAIALNPNSDDARCQLALVQNHIGQNEEALQGRRKPRTQLTRPPSDPCFKSDRRSCTWGNTKRHFPFSSGFRKSSIQEVRDLT